VKNSQLQGMKYRGVSQIASGIQLCHDTKPLRPFFIFLFWGEEGIAVVVVRIQNVLLSEQHKANSTL
jgi:hypothetical protein